MGIYIIFAFAFFLGFLYGRYIKPRKRISNTVRELHEKCRSILEGGKKGLYKTMVMDKNQASELVVEVQELAVTESGMVKVKYLDAFYKNPDFRTRKGEALLKEVYELLGDYLPAHEIEWYEAGERHEDIRNYMSFLENKYKRHIRI